MSEPLQPFQGEIWQRGAKLGLVWLIVLSVATVAVFGLMGLAGWSGTGRALCAMGVGPVVGLAAIGVWWLVRRPTLGAAQDRFDRGEKAREDDSVG